MLPQNEPGLLTRGRSARELMADTEALAGGWQLAAFHGLRGPLTLEAPLFYIQRRRQKPRSLSLSLTLRFLHHIEVLFHTHRKGLF